MLKSDFRFQIEMEFWGEYQEASNNFLLGEVWNPDPYYVAKYQEQMDSLFNFPLHDMMRACFTEQQDMKQLADSLVEQVSFFLLVWPLRTTLDVQIFCILLLLIGFSKSI